MKKKGQFTTRKNTSTAYYMQSENRWYSVTNQKQKLKAKAFELIYSYHFQVGAGVGVAVAIAVEMEPTEK